LAQLLNRGETPQQTSFREEQNLRQGGSIEAGQRAVDAAQGVRDRAAAVEEAGRRFDAQTASQEAIAATEAGAEASKINTLVGEKAKDRAAAKEATEFVQGRLDARAVALNLSNADMNRMNNNTKLKATVAATASKRFELINKQVADKEQAVFEQQLEANATLEEDYKRQAGFMALGETALKTSYGDAAIKKYMKDNDATKQQAIDWFRGQFFKMGTVAEARDLDSILAG